MAGNKRDLQEDFDKFYIPIEDVTVKNLDNVDELTSEDFDEELLDEEGDLSYDEGVEDGVRSAFLSVDQDYVVNKREDTRSRLAIIYTLLTFSVFFLGFISAILDALISDTSIITNLSEIIPLISGVFLGTLGFVMGYYFRKGEE